MKTSVWDASPSSTRNVGIRPIADIRGSDTVAGMNADTEQRLSDQIRRGLSRVGIHASRVQISEYSPQVFGNHIADVQTDDGLIQVVFDRQYEVNLLDSGIPPQRIAELQEALNNQRRSDAGSSAE